MALPKGVKSPVDYTNLYMSNELHGDELNEAVPAFIKGALKLGTKKRMALFGGGLFGTVAGVRAIGKGIKAIKDNKKKKIDAAIDKQVDKYVADRKSPIKKVNYMPDNMYTVTRNKDGKVSGTGNLIRVVPGTRTAKRLPGSGDDNTQSRFSRYTGSPFKASPLNKNKNIYGLKTEATMTPAQKRKDTMLKKKYEKSDDMMKSFKDQYGKEKGKNVFYAFIRKKSMEEGNIQEILDKKDVPHVKKLVKKLRDGSKTHAKQADELEVAMKTENTAIESELVIQDWNKDDIKFTEIETVDIIKAKPLKESMSNWREDLDEDWQKVNRKDKTDGLSKAAVKAYRRENPGSKLQTAVTKDPKKLKKGSKSAKRRLSFCRRMKGMKKKLTSAKTRRDPDSRINKALRRWNC